MPEIPVLFLQGTPGPPGDPGLTVSNLATLPPGAITAFLCTAQEQNRASGPAAVWQRWPVASHGSQGKRGEGWLGEKGKGNFYFRGKD